MSQDSTFAEHDTACALQRPDFYLYGTAARSGVPHVVLTHLIPPPETADDAAEAFGQDLRNGGDQVDVAAARDLRRIRL